MSVERAPRVGLYARVSTRDQNASMQLSDLRQLAEQRGWTIAGEFVDKGVSGTKDRRPELDKLMADARGGKLDVVACWRFDRFARSVRHLVLALDEFRARGIDFVSLHDGVDTSTPSGRFTFTIMAAVAEFERELIRERVIAGLADARRQGTRIGRRRRQIDVDHALELRCRGLSVRAVARRLGVPRSIVHRALREPAGGLCSICGSEAQVDMHGRARWHATSTASSPCSTCEGVGQVAVPIPVVPKPSGAEPPLSP